MTAGPDQPPAEGVQVEPIDPMEYFPDAISRIGGLGGTKDPPHPAYAFHTRYVTSSGGAITFTLRFVGLKASYGKLSLSINARPETGGNVEVVAAETVFMPNLLHDEGVVSIRLPTTRGTSYALIGYVLEEADATVEALHIDLTHLGEGSVHSRKLISERPTAFGRTAMRSTMRMIASEKATLAEPVSQICTAAQFDEPVYREWVERMGLTPRRHREEWESVYVLQALRRYGMLEAGARGLGFGACAEPLPAVMAAGGCTVMVTDRPADHAPVTDDAPDRRTDDIEAARRPRICPDELLDARVTFRSVDMTALPEDLTHFDFVWSSRVCGQLGSIDAGLRFVLASIACLKPGGIAVHTTELSLVANEAIVPGAGAPTFRRRDVERLAVALVSQGHEVAQIKYDAGNAPFDDSVDVPPYRSDGHSGPAPGHHATTSFGLIVRRGLHA